MNLNEGKKAIFHIVNDLHDMLTSIYEEASDGENYKAIHLIDKLIQLLRDFKSNLRLREKDE